MAFALSGRLLRLLSWRRKTAPLDNRVHDVLRDRFSPCPICGSCVAGHAFVKIASATVNKDDGRNQSLERLISTHQWRQASEYQDWSSNCSVREYYILRCPHGSQMALIRLLSTPDLWTDDQIGPNQNLAPDEFEAVLAIVGDKWTSL